MGHTADQHIEHAEHAKHASHDPFDRQVTVSIAVVAAILAAVTLEGHRGHNETLRLQGEALQVRNEALRIQMDAGIKNTETSDAWAFYQAKKIRGTFYEAFIDLADIIDEKGKAKGGEKLVVNETEKQKAKEGEKVIVIAGETDNANEGEKLHVKEGEKEKAKAGEKAHAKEGEKEKAKAGEKANVKAGEKAKSKEAKKGRAFWQGQVNSYKAELPKMKEEAEKLSKETKELQEESRKVLKESEIPEHKSHIVHKQTDRFDMGELGLQLGVVLCSLAILTKSRNFWYSGLLCSLLGFLVALSGSLGWFMESGGGHH